MSWSFKLLSVRGIPVRVHATFLLILVWAAYIGLNTRADAGWVRGVAFMVTLTLLLFACVVLHELGHSLVAQVFGIEVQDITLLPIGGMARIKRMPQRPLEEFVMAAAGPAVNILLALLLAGVLLIWIGPARVLQLATSPVQLERLLFGSSVQSLLLMLLFNNVMLALFNLIPAFPMDGGRLVRAVLAAFLPFGRATQAASWLGQGVAVVMAIAALLIPSFFLGLVAVFVFVGAWGERQQAVSTGRLAGLHVRTAMQPVGACLHPLDALGDAAGRVAALPQAGYLVVDAGRLIGILSRHDLLTALKKAGPAARVAQHFNREFLRLDPDDLLTDAAEQLAQAQPPLGVVTAAGRAIGLLSQADVVRLGELLEVCPSAVPRE